MLDALVVGSGAAGVSAALGLRGKSVLIADVGEVPPPEPGAFDPSEPGVSAQALKSGLLGERYESLHNVFRPYLSPKLKSPGLRFVTAAPEGAPKVVSSTFEAQQSFARGGLANAWGAGVYRFGAGDLAGFPLGTQDLEPDYDLLTRVIGVSGTEDDLAPFFGSGAGLQPPLPMPPLFERLLGRWRRRGPRLVSRGLHLGRPRVAVLTRPLGDRQPYDGRATEFFDATNESVFTPAVLLRQMRESGQVLYRDGFLAERFRERAASVVVEGVDLRTRQRTSIEARSLVLAAGALGSARLALTSLGDRETRLPLLENAVSYVPLMDPAGLGSPPGRSFFAGAALNAVYDGPRFPEPVQMTLYGMEGPLRSDFLFEIPFPARGLLAASRLLVPALVTVQLFYPDRPRAGNSVRLLASGDLEISFADARTGTELEGHLIGLFRALGLLGLRRLCRRLAPGNSFHYAGTLPMCAPGTSPCGTGTDGLLQGTRFVHVADASCFPRLPSKNHTFTVMAIAHRVGRLLAERLV